MTHILLEDELNSQHLFEDWRFKAREALVRGIPPADIDFEDPNDNVTLRIAFSADSAAPPHPRTPHPEPHVPAAFLYAAQAVARHSDPTRWNLLYRLLWRLQTDSNLLRIAIDPDVAALRRMETQVPHDTPELPALHLMKKASQRAEEIVLRAEKFPTAAPWVPARHTLPVLREAMPHCKGCDLYACATQVVPGQGAARPLMMLVGEIPGDSEDKQGKPFVGPAGKLLRGVLSELGIAPNTVFFTNAVKHGSFTQKGKRRVGQAPKASEVNACKPWLLAEIDALRPPVIVALGATAAKSLLGNGFALMKQHGQLIESPHAEHVIATIHPSAVLRARGHAGDGDHDDLYAMLKNDLAYAYSFAQHQDKMSA